MKNILIAAAAIMCVAGSTGFAMDIECSDVNIIVSGTTAADSDVRLNIVSEDGELVWIDSSLSNAAGEYKLEVVLPSEEKTKEYIVSVNSVDKQTVKIKGTEEITDLFKKCTEEEFQELIQLYADRFEFNIEEYQKLSDKKTMYSIFKSCSISDKISVTDAYFASCGICRINESGRGEVDGILKKYSEYIAKDYAKDSAAMSKSQSEKFAILLSSGKYASLSEFKNAYSRALSDAKKPDGGSSSGGGGGTSVSGGRGGAVSPPSQIQKPNDENLPETEPFSDIADVEWAHESIISLFKNGIINGVGDGKFAPNDAVTREEFTAMIARCFGLKGMGTDLKFKDVLKDSWYAESVRLAVENEIVFGISEDEFGTGLYLTRQDCAAMCARILKMADMEPEITKDAFSDDTSIAEYAKQGIYMLRQIGVISGVGENRFDPNGNCTRAMTAKIIYSLSEYLNNK